MTTLRHRNQAAAQPCSRHICLSSRIHNAGRCLPAKKIPKYTPPTVAKPRQTVPAAIGRLPPEETLGNRRRIPTDARDWLGHPGPYTPTMAGGGDGTLEVPMMGKARKRPAREAFGSGVGGPSSSSSSGLGRSGDGGGLDPSRSSRHLEDPRGSGSSDMYRPYTQSAHQQQQQQQQQHPHQQSPLLAIPPSPFLVNPQGNVHYSRHRYPPPQAGPSRSIAHIQDQQHQQQQQQHTQHHQTSTHTQHSDQHASHQQRPDYYELSPYTTHQQHIYSTPFTCQSTYTTYRDTPTQSNTNAGPAVAAEAEGGAPATSNAPASSETPHAEVNKNVKGLRHFSRCVADKVQLKGTTTYNEVADELVEEFTAQAKDVTTQKFDHKNIRRRVYDALNVLMAMDIIEKDRKEIRWTGLPTEGSLQREMESLQRHNAELKSLCESERRLINERMHKQRLIKALLRRNLQRAEVGESDSANSGSSTDIPPPEDSIQLPFLILSSAADANVNVQTNADSSQCIVSFSKPFDMVEDVEVISMIVGREQATPDYKDPSALIDFAPGDQLRPIDHGPLNLGHPLQPLHVKSYTAGPYGSKHG
ncbi:E2F/DP family winged-helix DNA-binding domain-containing protein [Phlyctochytrium arcticum]|nr:E2F/DP family winged-helix DNA-binding domain-containing protein [Phlyctochytrium arcticum]